MVWKHQIDDILEQLEVMRNAVHEQLLADEEHAIEAEHLAKAAKRLSVVLDARKSSAAGKNSRVFIYAPE